MIPEVVGWWALAVIVGVIVLSAAGYGAVRAWRWWRDRQAEQAYQAISVRSGVVRLTREQWAVLLRKYPPHPPGYGSRWAGIMSQLDGRQVVIVRRAEDSTPVMERWAGWTE